MLQYTSIIALSHSNALIRVSRNYDRSMLEHATQTNLILSFHHAPEDKIEKEKRARYIYIYIYIYIYRERERERERESERK